MGDTQLFYSFKFQDQATSVRANESCFKITWMLAIVLKLNKEKTELLVIGPKHTGGYSRSRRNARNVFVIFYTHINLENSPLSLTEYGKNTELSLE